jgi:hypothetical protein
MPKREIAAAAATKNTHILPPPERDGIAAQCCA